MKILRNKLFLSIGFFSLISSSLLLPITMAYRVIVSSILFLVSHYVYSNYEIDFKYYFSFIAELFVLVFIVTSLCLVLFLSKNYIML